MKGFIKGMDDLPLWAKIILALPALDIIWVIYRVCRSIARSNVLGVILAILLVIIGIPFMWLVDIITLLITHTVLWID